MRILVGMAFALATALNAAEPAPPPGGTGPRGQLQGSAQIRRNLPVIGAVVKVTLREAPSDLRITTTDARGAFRFDGLADGRYRVEVAHDGFATVVKEGVELRAPFRAVVEVPMVKTTPGPSTSSGQGPSTGSAQAIPLRGIVRDKDGRPSGEVRVRLIRVDGSEDPRQAVTTAGGEFAFDQLTAGGWNLEMLGAGLLPVRTPLVLSEATTIAAVLAAQPADYPPAIEDLMPNEEPIAPPEAFAAR